MLTDSLSGECGDVISVLQGFHLPFIVAIRSNHGGLMPQGQKVRYNRWRAYTKRVVSSSTRDMLYSRVLSLVNSVKNAQSEISKTDSPTTSPLETWFIMTNLPKSWQLQLGKRYSLRGWIEYGFKQVKNERSLGRFSPDRLCQY